MPNKKVKITECCVITDDDKGQRSLVGKAKEALTTLTKNKVDVYIVLEGTDKEAAEKFLKDNNVPFKDLLSREEAHEQKFDACVICDNKVVIMRGDWQWAMEQLVDKLYDTSEKEQHPSEQQKMDDKFKDYKRWTEESNKARAKRLGAT